MTWNKDLRGVVSAVSVFGLLATQSVWAASGTWTGAASAVWTNKSNWSGSSYPSGADTATFTNAGNGNTAIDLAGLSSIKKIDLSSASAAPYTFGIGGANGQTLALGDAGAISLVNGAANTQTVAAVLQLGTNRVAASYTLSAGACRLVIDGDVAGAPSGGTAGVKTLSNTGAGETVINGSISDGGATQVALAASGTGLLVLAGANTFSGGVSASDGTVRLTSTGTLGSGAKIVSIVGDTTAKFPSLQLDGSEGAITVPASVAFQTSNKHKGAIVNLAGTNTILGSITLVAGDHDSWFSSEAGKLILAGNISAGDTVMRQVVLKGDGDGEISGVLANGSLTAGMPVIKSDGTGTWTFTGANTYSGATTVIQGVLRLLGTNGSICRSSRVTVSNGASLVLANTAAANNSDRLGDDKPLSLMGGSLVFTNDGSSASFSETGGVLTVISTGNTVSVAPAADGHSALTFSGLALTAGASVNFVGAGLGESDTNRIFIAGQPDGLIGAWATYNGTQLACYASSRGVYGQDSVITNIAARGPGSVIPDDPVADVRVTELGESGPITLAGDPTNSVYWLRQSATTSALVATASKTLRAGGFTIQPGKSSLTIGELVGEGSVVPLGADGNLVLDNQSSAALTIHAAIADGEKAAALTKCGPGEVTVKGPTTYTGPTVVAEGSLTFAGHAFAQRLAGAISGDGGLVKSGTNLLHLLGANSFAGRVTVSAGIVRPNSSYAFGSALEGTVIESGATLDVGCSPDVGGTRAPDALNMQAEPFTVAGAGVDGAGVIVNSSTGSQMYALGNVALSGDATFSTPVSRWDFRNGTFAMNDYGVVKTGAERFGLVDENVLPGASGAAGFDIRGGLFRLANGTKLNGSQTNTVLVRSGSELELYNLQYAQPWSIVFEGGTVFDIASQGSADTSLNRWSGPVTLGGPVTLTGGGVFFGTISGPISGPGSISKTGMPYVMLTGTNNTYTGTTSVAATRLYVSSIRNVGEPSSMGQPMTPEAGTIKMGSGGDSAAIVYTGTGDTTDRVIDMAGTSGSPVLYQNGTGPLKYTSTPVISVSGSKAFTFRGSSTNAGAEFAGSLADGPGSVISVLKDDASSWTLSGTNTYTGTTTVNNGTLVFSGTNVCTGATTVNNGTLIWSGTNVFSGTLTIAKGTALVTGLLNQKGGACLGSGATNANAVIRMSAGAVLAGASNTFSIGRSNGAFYMDGGSLLRPTVATDGEWFCFGYNAGGYGYFKMSGGTVATPRLQLGPSVSSPGALGYGIARITDGNLAFTGNMHISRNVNSIGVLTLDGGTFDRSAATTECNIGYEGGRGELNITGGTFDSRGKNIIVRNNAGYPTGIVNICSGSLSVSAFENRTGGTAWINFCGGTLRAGAVDSITFLPSTLTGVYAYGPFETFAGGGVIDTAGRNVTAVAPIQAPAGSGVYAISLSGLGSGYIGEPYVSIRGGDGFGATAVANMEDDGTGNGTYRVASVTVTSPGVGYASGNPPAVTFLRGGYGATPPTVAGVTLLPNTSGGLTKQGAGTLTLSAANTYTGATVVAGGTLKLGHPLALSTNSAVVLAGGLLNLNTYTVTNALGGSGTVSNGSAQVVLSPAGEGSIGTNALTLASASLRGTYLADATLSGACDLVALTSATVDLSALTLKLVNPAALDRHQAYTLLTWSGTKTGTLVTANLPENWRVVYTADGKATLIYLSGTLLKIL